MGWSHSWIAVRRGREEVIAALGLAPGKSLGHDYPRKGLAIADLPGGWRVALTDDFDAAFKGSLAKLADLGAAVACQEDEQVMYSEARGYEQGAETWRVTRDCNRAPWLSVDVQGVPPPSFEAIRDQLFREQEQEGGEGADVDLIYDIPPRVAHAVCGFRLGEDLPGDGEFTQLVGERRGGGLLSRLFGRD